MARVSAGREADLGPGKSVRIEAGGGAVLVANAGGSLCAVSDTCTHAGASLAEGRIEGGRVVCGWHGAEFDCKTGCLAKFPAKVPDLRSYPVSVEGGEVFVEV